MRPLTPEHDDAHRLRRRRPDRLVLDGLHGGRRRGASLLRLHVALRLLDAHARRGGELPAPARRLGARRPRLVPADRVLAPQARGGRGGEEGVRHERDRRRDVRARLVLLIWATGTLEFGSRLRPGRLDVHDDRQPRRPRPPRRRDREVGADPAPHLASRRDGRPNAGLRADPRGDDGDRRRLPARPREPDLRGRARRPAPRRDPRRDHAARRRSRRARAVGHQARHRVLDDVADRLHVPRPPASARTATRSST